MATSFGALPGDLQRVLVALVDCPPGPVAQRDLAASVRRHADGGLSRAVPDLLDLLADHFVRVTPDDRVAWVHPSWRDLVIERVAADAEARRALPGAVLGRRSAARALDRRRAAGERSLPLLVEDADWDSVGARLYDLTPALDDHDALRLLLALREALAHAIGTDRAEVAAIAGSVLTRLRGLVGCGARCRSRSHSSPSGSPWRARLREPARSAGPDRDVDRVAADGMRRPCATATISGGSTTG